MVVLGVVCIALLGVIVYVLRERRNEAAEWGRERQLLISRIQHPEVVIPGPTVTEANLSEAVEHLVSEGDDIDLVGTVQVNGVNDGD